MHPDWEFLPARRSPEADAWMQHWGIGFGDIKDAHNLGKINDPASHWFLKERRVGTVERLKRLNWDEVAYPTLSSPRLHKSEVVAAYIGAYGDPDGADYDPEDRGASEYVAAPEATAPPAAPPGNG